MEVLKKYWLQIVIVIVVAAAVGILVWFLKPTKIVVQDTSQVQPHKFDSLKYIHKVDSINLVLVELRKKDEKNRLAYAVLLREQNVLNNLLKTIPPVKVVELFSEKTGDKATLHLDSTATISLLAMRTAVGLFIAGEQCLDREVAILNTSAVKDAVMASYDSLLSAKNERIFDLTREFYDSQLRITGLGVTIAKQDRRNRTKNIIIGVVSGVAVLGITGTIIAITK
jgi:hypothetical protein